MKNLVWFFFLFNLAFNITKAATPTPEGLFRNGNNQDITANVVSIKLLINEVNNEPTSETKEGKIEKYEKYYKLTFYLNKGGADVSLVEYPSVQMNENSSLNARFVEDFSKKIMADKNQSRIVFYAVMSVLGLNSSKLITQYFKKINPEFPSNVELLNAPATFEATEQALKENIAEESEGVKDELFEEELHLSFKQTDFVKIDKKGESFYWRILMPKIDAFFTFAEHQIEKLTISTTENKNIEYNFYDFTLFDGLNLFPKKIYIKEEGNIYSLKILSVVQGKNIEKNTFDMAQSLSKKRKDSTFNWPDFL